MSFRRPKSDEHRRQAEWANWIAEQRDTLLAMGVSPEVFLSVSHWEDFLENGYLEWHPQDSSGFDFDQLSPASAGALRRFLALHYGNADRCPPLLAWLRARHEAGQIE
jgi:hypothetical protein